MKRAAIYARMSTDKQSSDSPADQVARCREYRYRRGTRSWVDGSTDMRRKAKAIFYGREGSRVAIRAVLCFAILMLLTPLSLSASAADRLILEATPSVRVVSSTKTTHFRQVTKDEREAAKIRIEIRRGKLIWVTREERELIYSAGGIMHHFIEPGGGGYVTVMDQSILSGDLPDGAEVVAELWHPTLRHVPGEKFRYSFVEIESAEDMPKEGGLENEGGDLRPDEHRQGAGGLLPQSGG